MSFSDQITSDVTGVFLDTTDGFAVSTTRYALGDEGSATPDITGIFIEDEPERDTSRGDEVIRKGTLTFAATQTTDDRDAWLINSQRWEVITSGHVEQGMQSVRVQRRAGQTRSGLGELM